MTVLHLEQFFELPATVDARSTERGAAEAALPKIACRGKEVHFRTSDELLWH
jgi:hypothetical protein